ncbi:hypothetical protein BGX30_010279 [Mortierella sp. GBA39]|nr:hypothetical protein BGX30_010279 [Mortierella sp. GBA39]
MVQTVSTPVVIVDLDIAERNIRSMAEEARKAGIRHRPHIKSHKSVYFARKQLEAGSTGITCAKLGEAEVMAEAGIDDILIAFPIIGEDKQERLYQLAQKVKVTTVADSVEGATAVSEVGERLGRRIPLCIEVDGGIGRCGRQPGEDTLQFARQIHSLPGIEITGLLSYAGQIYGEESREEIRSTARQEAATLKNTADLLREAGIDVPVVSGGSSLSSKFAGELEGVTEIRKLHIPRRGPIVDGHDHGGRLRASGDHDGRQRFGYIVEHPDIEIFKLNEEHGFLSYDPASVSLHIGQHLTIIPNHACVLPNLCDEIVGFRGGVPVEKIRIDARGKNS